MFNGPVFNNEVVQANSRAVNNAGFSESLDEANSLYSRLTGASFELVPSSYRGGIVYSGVPNTGNGDITWTRGSDAWRTNSNGLVQRAPWNLLLQSETFDNAYWTKSNASINSNSVLAPNGTLTADKIVESTSNSSHNILSTSATVVTGNNYVSSIYAKAGERNWILVIYFDGSVVKGRYFDLTNGVGGTYWLGLTITNSITSVGDGWWRITLSYPATTTSNIFGVYLANGDNANSYTGNGTNGAYVWGAQLVEGSNALPYFPTTDRLNVPRLSYEYGSSPALLLEPQRTNLALYSQDFDNSYWVKNQSATVTANTTTSPDGTTNADTLSVAALSFSGIYRAISGASANYTISIYAKKNTKNWLYLFDATGAVARAWFNLDSGVLGTVASGYTATITSVGNGWYRCTLTNTTATSASYYQFGLSDSDNSTTPTSSGSAYIFGAQLELGAYPTTYIQTVATTVTRLADSFTRNNIYTNGLITAAGGTWFVELRNNIAYVRDNTSAGLFISDDINNSVGNSFYIQATGSDKLRISKRVSGLGTQIFLTTTNTVKIAIKWNGSTADVFVNGIKQVSATAFPTTNMEYLNSINTDTPKFIQQMALFHTPLSDDQCVALTSDFTEGESVIGSYERYVNSNGGAVENLNTITNLIQNLK